MINQQPFPLSVFFLTDDVTESYITQPHIHIYKHILFSSESIIKQLCARMLFAYYIIFLSTCVCVCMYVYMYVGDDTENDEQPTNQERKESTSKRKKSELFFAWKLRLKRKKKGIGKVLIFGSIVRGAVTLRSCYFICHLAGSNFNGPFLHAPKS